LNNRLKYKYDFAKELALREASHIILTGPHRGPKRWTAHFMNIDIVKKQNRVKGQVEYRTIDFKNKMQSQESK